MATEHERTTRLNSDTIVLPDSSSDNNTGSIQAASTTSERLTPLAGRKGIPITATTLGKIGDEVENQSLRTDVMRSGDDSLGETSGRALNGNEAMETSVRKKADERRDPVRRHSSSGSAVPNRIMPHDSASEDSSDPSDDEDMDDDNEDKTSAKPKTTKQIADSPEVFAQVHSPALGSRKEKRLSIVAARFVEYLQRSSSGEINLNAVAEDMGVKKRRVYDVVNVLEGCSLVQRTGRSRITWCANFPMSGLPSLDERMRLAMDVGANKQKFRKRIGMPFVGDTSHTESDLDTQLAKLQRLDQALDATLPSIRTKLSSIMVHAGVPVDAIRAVLDVKDKTVLAIGTPNPTTIRVHAPLKSNGPTNQLRCVTIDCSTKMDPSSELSLAVFHPREDRILEADFGSAMRAHHPVKASATGLFLGATELPSLTQEDFALSQVTVDTLDRLVPTMSQ